MYLFSLRWGSTKGALSARVLVVSLHSSPFLSCSIGPGWIWQVGGPLSPSSWPRAQAWPQALRDPLNCCPLPTPFPQSYDNQRRLPPEFFRENAPLNWPETFLTEKEVSRELWLEPGTYLIVPCTSEPRQESEFVLRVFSRSHVF